MATYHTSVDDQIKHAELRIYCSLLGHWIKRLKYRPIWIVHHLCMLEWSRMCIGYHITTYVVSCCQTLLKITNEDHANWPMSNIHSNFQPDSNGENSIVISSAASLSTIHPCCRCCRCRLSMIVGYYPLISTIVNHDCWPLSPIFVGYRSVLTAVTYINHYYSQL